MTTDDDLLAELSDALAPEDREPPAERVAELRAAAARRGTSQFSSAPNPPGPARDRRRVAVMAVAAAAAVVGFAAGSLLLDRPVTRDQGVLAGGVVEFEVTLVDPDGRAVATATGIRTGIGRTVQLRTDDLPILPTGDLYELWFVGPRDTPDDPNRISAGTFHPDEHGRSRVDLTAAVDPTKYPEISITAEPGDGDPNPSGPEVLRAEITLDGS